MTQVWARAVAAGVDDAVFWDATPAEIRELLGQLLDRAKREAREAALRAGVVASAIWNASGRSRRRVRPSDFVRDEPKPTTPAEFRAWLIGWAREHNEAIQA